ncbi:MAG: HAMP domain-containing histidine kinase [Synergistaceae bacterium]|jgi:signal transduction histidine kinase|nr:HAMP domain-containing histidine kinase [Synergistaceae bacterium]
MIKRARTLLAVFVLAVLLPSIALSMLALRAAERESAYVERRLEGAIAAEVDLAVQAVERLIESVHDSLAREAGSVPSPTTPEKWRASNPFVKVVFAQKNGRLEVWGENSPEERLFREDFQAFLNRDARLPVYDLVTRVYRTIPADFSGGVQTGMQTNERQTKYRSSSGILRQKTESRMALSAETREKVFEQASQEGFEILRRNVIPRVQSEAGAVPAAPAAASPKIPASSMAHKMDDAAVRSRTVSKNRSFEELRGESEGGLLPYLSAEGLEVLFWKQAEDGGAVGCTLRMDEFRDRVAAGISNILSDVRILTILDENGTPLVTPDRSDGAPAVDWSRPFVAREISPTLPRWEAGAWLLDPRMFAARADYVKTVVWVLVAILFSVIIAGSLAAIRMMSYEMRVASQKTTFVANVSHELKTPLTSIKLYAELLLSGRQTNEERKREYLRTMMSESDRLAHLVDNVLSFSRRGGEKFQTELVSLSHIARETTDQLGPHMSKLGFTVSLTAQEDVCVQGNPAALKQVIMNLLSNAEKYSGEHREIEVRCRSKNGFALCEVADRGIGVPRGMEEKIFQEFVRGDDTLTAPRSGTGLGLSIARDIARRHGGDVQYAPRDGGGSVFCLVLPEVRKS